MALSNEMQKPIELAIRKFVFSSFRIFDDTDKRTGVLRQIMGDERSEASAKQAILHRSSRLFRDQLSTLLADIDLVETAYSNQNGYEVPPDLLQPECDLAVYLSMTWHLCEVYFLNQSNHNSLDLINWLKMNGAPPINLEGTIEKFRSIRNPQNFQPEESAEDLKPLWPSIYALLLEGRLEGAWEIMSLHSDLAKIITSDRESDRGDRIILESIYDILHSHPFVDIVNTLNQSNQESEMRELPPGIVLEFKDWQDKISQVLRCQSPLLGRISELSTVLLMLAGDKDTLVHQSGEEWTSLSVGLFLYVYPPPLIWANISKIVVSAMTLIPVRNDISNEEIRMEKRLRGTVCSIMNGDASATLKSLIEVCGWGNSPKDYCSLFGLLSAGHLIYLLAQAGVAAATVIHNTSNGINISDHQTSSDLSTDMRSTFNNDVRSGVEVLGELLGGGKMGASLAANLSSEASFVEELFLECSQRLNELQFPLDIVVGYLQVCPKRGKEYARVLLPYRRAHTDSAVCAVSHALRTFGLYSEASAVEASRGSWWLKPRGSENGTFEGGRVIKAVRFYQLAGDINRTAAILDRALWRCCTALVRMSTVLTVHQRNNNDNNSSSSSVADFLFLIPRGLRMHPVHPSGPSVTGQTILADYWDLRHYSESQPAVPLKDLAGTIQAIDIETKNFFAAVGDAEEILGALTSPGVHATQEVQSLQGFVRILRALITIRIPIIETSEWGNSTNFNQLLAGIPCEDWKMISHYDSANSFSKSVTLTRAEREEAVLRYAADALCKLLKDEILPMRFWLPILDLCVGLDVIMTKRKCACLYTTSQAYNLLEVSERVFAVQANHKSQITSVDVVLEDEKKRSLRLGLLGILSGAVIQANADAGFTKRKSEEDVKSRDAAELLRFRYPADKIQQQNTLELLSASAFL